MNLARELKTVLEFFDALGFDRLPVSGRGKRESAATGKREREMATAGSSDLRSSELKEAALMALREEIGDCRRCKLSRGRKNIVFGEGRADAALMFIGEGPGREEDLQGRPFVGDAGVLLTRLIEKMGLGREDVFIANIVKCRPPMNRDPEGDEITTCLPFLVRQIEIVMPAVIVSLGRISAHTLLETTIPITRLRGKFSSYRGIPLMPTFHPAYLLRNPKDKWLVWEDALKVLERARGEGR
ncbi:MAG TPA: uracil-DNA glycosylase [Thermodesulfovibrionales bacterium]|nr:uracil-DNA glycosylase [Thermodesulfovibrionales bacterium]